MTPEDECAWLRRLLKERTHTHHGGGDDMAVTAVVSTVMPGKIELTVSNGTRSTDDRTKGLRHEYLSKEEALALVKEILDALVLADRRAA